MSHPATETGDLRRRHHEGEVGQEPHGKVAYIDAAVVAIALVGGGGPVLNLTERGESSIGSGGGPFVPEVIVGRLEPVGAQGTQRVKKFDGAVAERHQESDPVLSAFIDGDEELIKVEEVGTRDMAGPASDGVVIIGAGSGEIAVAFLEEAGHEERLEEVTLT